jgi:type II secretory pathway pseudopilin PulG
LTAKVWYFFDFEEIVVDYYFLIRVFMKTKHFAFTLIDLLVVIAVIALLATLSVIVLSNARAKSRDVKRLADIKNITTALEIYYDNFGSYPLAPSPTGTAITGLCLSDSGITTTCGTMVYMSEIPADPRSGTNYLYSTVVDNSRYQLIYDEETNISCPSNWVRVPGNTLYDTHSFCVMKYEAKNVDGTPVSRTDDTQWVSVAQAIYIPPHPPAAPYNDPPPAPSSSGDDPPPSPPDGNLP